MNTLPWPLLAAAATAATLLLAWLLTRPRRPPVMPFTKRASLLTAAERRFYKVLLRAVPDSLTVFVKVRLLDVLMVPVDA
jgi:hypothetical protein